MFFASEPAPLQQASPTAVFDNGQWSGGQSRLGAFLHGKADVWPPASCSTNSISESRRPQLHPPPLFLTHTTIYFPIPCLFTNFPRAFTFITRVVWCRREPPRHLVSQLLPNQLWPILSFQGWRQHQTNEQVSRLVLTTLTSGIT